MFASTTALASPHLALHRDSAASKTRRECARKAWEAQLFFVMSPLRREAASTCANILPVPVQIPAEAAEREWPVAYGLRLLAHHALERIVRWYADQVYGRLEGGSRRPFYCDPGRVGAFAIAPGSLAAGREDALFRMLVLMAMYQSRRDVDIMAIQRGMSRASATALVSRRRLRVLVDGARCALPRDQATFDDACTVRRDFDRGSATCDRHPRTACHVKDATMAIGRMGDMGKLATSAWLHVEAGGGLRRLVDEAVGASESAAAAADRMVVHLAQVHRIGTKLATMYVSALSTPALAPGLAPWWPRVDGNHLVVVDANVGRVIDLLRPRGPRTYAARSGWFRDVAARIDLRTIRRDWPHCSPRLVQQAVYVFRSQSNRTAAGDGCSGTARCHAGVPKLCPFPHATRG